MAAPPDEPRMGSSSGRGLSAVAFSFALGWGLVGCGSSSPFAPNPDDYIRTCTLDDGVKVVRVDDRYCNDNDVGHAGGYGWYYQQYPPQYDEDGYDQDSSVTIVNVGQPVAPGSGTRFPPKGLSTVRVGKAPTVLGGGTRSVIGGTGSSTISRGGLGVSRAGGSGS